MTITIDTYTYMASIASEAHLAGGKHQHDVAARCYYRAACLAADYGLIHLFTLYRQLSDKAEAMHFVKGKGVVDWKGM